MHLSIEKSSRETETKLTNFWLQERFLAKYFHFITRHVILRSLSCMYTASCTRNLQTDKMLRELERLKILLSFCTRCCTIFWPKMLPGETLCKMVQIFPPKVLEYIRKVFLDTLIENQLTN